MSTIKDKIRFNFDGIWSDTYGLIHVVLDGGMFDETFIAERELNETRIRGSDRPALHSVEDSPIQFDMVVAFEDKFSESKIDNIIKWLFANHYKPLYFEGKEDRVYNCIFIGEPRIIHNGLNEGYFTLTVRCDSSNLYSPLITTNLEVITTNKTITVSNNGHLDTFMEISLKKNGYGNIVIESLDDGNSIFEIRDLTDLEDIYIDCEREIIETDAIGVYRYDKIIGEFPRLFLGTNRFKVTGACEIRFRYVSRYRF
ncbi:phage tail domain-containing protein [Bacillus sp. FJAT-50079]|uniref:phage tail domain-containing protein n=1 Tax=Bacillus sp. FJAT-50079 TaxID=2833577 RepID=UPI001BCA6391|nr:phage tail domain-containing protein [Bacillus sp. FJAT-50079]MBS4207462.1 phage tail family protein [Bacillus sp. FJAT-50079]